jgi:hypothetical protein
MNELNDRTNIKLADPVNVSKYTKYLQKGLTAVSNDTSVHPRDEAGNIILHENSISNPTLVIEPTSYKITTDSMLKVLDTTFEYFKFPVTVIVDSGLNLDLDLSGGFDALPDLVYARYKPSTNFSPAGNPDFTPTGILMDVVEDGLPQAETNKYKISKDIKNSGVDLRVRAQIEHTTPTGGNIYFYVARSGPSNGLDLTWKGPFQTGDGSINSNQTQTAFVDFIVTNSDIQIGDIYQIAAQSGQSDHVINADQTYFVVTDASKNVDTWNQPIG